MKLLNRAVELPILEQIRKFENQLIWQSKIEVVAKECKLFLEESRKSFTSILQY